MIFFALSLVAAAAQTPAVNPADIDANNKIVCKRVVITGSRMPGKRVCMSVYDWRLTESRAQREVIDLKSRSQVENGPVF